MFNLSVYPNWNHFYFTFLFYFLLFMFFTISYHFFFAIFPHKLFISKMSDQLVNRLIDSTLEYISITLIFPPLHIRINFG